MTVGERIQYYRKLSGLSQEELGQKLLVSRQTVSLWENDQTVPTIDNLLRLKEIFGVSVDELLGDEAAPAQQNDERPYEEYSYMVSGEDNNKMKNYIFSVAKRTLFLVIAIIVLISLAYALFDSPTEGMATKFFIYAVGMTAILIGVFFLTRRALNRIWNSQQADLLETNHIYRFFNGYMTIDLEKNSEVMNSLKVYYDKIDKIHNLGNFQLIETGKQVFPISTADFENSPFFNQFIAINPKKHIDKLKEGRWKTLSLFFALLAGFSPLFVPGFAEVLMKLLYLGPGFEFINLKALFLVAVLPLSSVVFGIVALCKKIKAKKNIIVGVIALLVVCLIAYGYSLGGNILESNDEAIVEFEEATGYDLPETDWLMSMNNLENEYEDEFSDFSDADYCEKTGWYCVFTVNEKDGAEFEEKIKNDPNWLTDESDDSLSVYMLTNEFEGKGYFLAYNTKTGQYNTGPDNPDEECMYYNISYDSGTQMFILQELYLNYQGK